VFDIFLSDWAFLTHRSDAHVHLGGRLLQLELWVWRAARIVSVHLRCRRTQQNPGYDWREARVVGSFHLFIFICLFICFFEIVFWCSVSSLGSMNWSPPGPNAKNYKKVLSGTISLAHTNYVRIKVGFRRFWFVEGGVFFILFWLCLFVYLDSNVLGVLFLLLFSLSAHS
jgi:hypothetical protein